MTDIKQIYTSHQSLVGTVTPSVIRTVPFSLGGYAPSGKWYSPYNFGCYSSNQRLALAWTTYDENLPGENATELAEIS